MLRIDGQLTGNLGSLKYSGRFPRALSDKGLTSRSINSSPVLGPVACPSVLHPAHMRESCSSSNRLIRTRSISEYDRNLKIDPPLSSRVQTPALNWLPRPFVVSLVGPAALLGLLDVLELPMRCGGPLWPLLQVPYVSCHTG